MTQPDPGAPWSWPYKRRRPRRFTAALVAYRYGAGLILALVVWAVSGGPDGTLGWYLAAALTLATLAAGYDWYMARCDARNEAARSGQEMSPR